MPNVVKGPASGVGSVPGGDPVRATYRTPTRPATIVRLAMKLPDITKLGSFDPAAQGALLGAIFGQASYMVRGGAGLSAVARNAAIGAAVATAISRAITATELADDAASVPAFATAPNLRTYL